MPLYMDLHSLDVVTFEDVGKAATTVQDKAHDLVAHEIYEMQEGS